MPLKCNFCNQYAAVIANDEKKSRVCMNCGGKFTPIKLSEKDLARIEAAIEAQEKRDAREVEELLWTPRKSQLRDW